MSTALLKGSPVAPAGEQPSAAHNTTNNDQNTEISCLADQNPRDELRECLKGRLPMLERIMRRRGRHYGLDIETIREAMHQTLIEALLSIESGEAAKMPNGWRWLLIRARWRLLDQLRQKKRKHLELVETSLVSERREEYRALLLDVVEEAFKRLPMMDQKLLQMCKIDGCSCKKAGELLGVHAGTVHRKLAIALERLGKNFKHLLHRVGIDSSELPKLLC